MVQNPIELEVKESYAKVARNLLAGNDSGCCGPVTQQPVQKNESLGCDIRLIDIADPQPGEVVIDLGSGPGYDTRRVAPKVAPGKVYGVDFGEDMIVLANARRGEHDNIEYVLGNIVDVPLPDNTADLIISNCVFNLVPNKAKVFEEVYRLLKPGGRVVVSDMIADSKDKQVTDADMCACVGGATSIDNYIQFMKDTGLEKIDYLTEFEDTYQGEVEEISYQSVLFSGYKPS